MILQIHDELLFETDQKTAQIFTKQAQKIMENAWLHFSML